MVLKQLNDGIIKGKFRSADASQNYLILGKKFY
jgi:hypothetical protein